MRMRGIPLVEDEEDRLRQDEAAGRVLGKLPRHAALALGPLLTPQCLSR